MRNLLITTAFIAIMFSTWSLGTPRAFTNHAEAHPRHECAPYQHTRDNGCDDRLHDRDALRTWSLGLIHKNCTL
jgi:hypothetical protein